MTFFLLESQLQLAFINQVYFHEKDPETIFGLVQLDRAHEMIQSLDNQGYPSFLPSNFV